MVADEKEEAQPLTLEELYEKLRLMAKTLPAWIERVDADVSERPDLWGKRVIHVVLPYGKHIWLQEAVTRGRE